MSMKKRLSANVAAVKENPQRLAVYLLLGVFFVFVVPAILPESRINLLNRMLIWGLFAMAYDFMYGYSGMVSFGHAALFGLGAYSVAIPLREFGEVSIWALLILAMLVSSVYALVVGTIAIRTREVYFAILTLAFAEMIYILVINFTSLTGGFDGMTILLPQLTVIPGVMEVSLYEAGTYYYMIIALVAGSYFTLRRLANSPMGTILRGVRENIERLEYIGIDERRYRIAAFSISGAISGLAGALYAIDLSFIGAEALEVIVSGEVIVWTILGGKGTLVGPLFGGAAVYAIEEIASGIITWWLIPVGILFILVVIFLPDGVAGLVKIGLERIRNTDA
ncbi:MAG: branched-chain amino acid ABC transporter permease [Halobacteriota archaeon]|uniref:branched-chain amino acid ABC transporter permease n=1 Tax=Natronomonas sp. TaxID=2184060 RepID=UPI003974BC75